MLTAHPTQPSGHTEPGHPHPEHLPEEKPCPAGRPGRAVPGEAGLSASGPAGGELRRAGSSAGPAAPGGAGSAASAPKASLSCVTRRSTLSAGDGAGWGEPLSQAAPHPARPRRLHSPLDTALMGVREMPGVGDRGSRSWPVPTGGSAGLGCGLPAGELTTCGEGSRGSGGPEPRRGKRRREGSYLDGGAQDAGGGGAGVADVSQVLVAGSGRGGGGTAGGPHGGRAALRPGPAGRAVRISRAPGGAAAHWSLRGGGAHRATPTATPRQPVRSAVPARHVPPRPAVNLPRQTRPLGPRYVLIGRGARHRLPRWPEGDCYWLSRRVGTASPASSLAADWLGPA